MPADGQHCYLLQHMQSQCFCVTNLVSHIWNRTNIWVVHNKILPLPCVWLLHTVLAALPTNNHHLATHVACTEQQIVLAINHQCKATTTIACLKCDLEIYINELINIEIYFPSVVVISRQISHSYSVGSAWLHVIITYQLHRLCQVIYHYHTATL